METSEVIRHLLLRLNPKLTDDDCAAYIQSADLVEKDVIDGLTDLYMTFPVVGAFNSLIGFENDPMPKKSDSTPSDGYYSLADVPDDPLTEDLSNNDFTDSDFGGSGDFGGGASGDF